jgi:hypothetical protein
MLFDYTSSIMHWPARRAETRFRYIDYNKLDEQIDALGHRRQKEGNISANRKNIGISRLRRSDEIFPEPNASPETLKD